MKFFIRTLGCKMNQLDSARFAAVLKHAGYTQAEHEADADWILVNSCTVTAQSDRKSRQAASAAVRSHKKVAVLGCGPRVDAERWRQQLPGSDVFESESGFMAQLGLERDAMPFPVTSRTRLPVAIQRGCDDTCAFCITRVARGRHQSETREDVVARVRQAEQMGIREVVLTGINLAAWGCEDSRRPEQSRLPELLHRLLESTGVPRIRLSSLGPQYLGGDFFEAFTETRICAHLHLSVQSGSDGVLRRMRRGHGVDEVYAAAEAARRVRQDVALTADLIAGFPGETASEFRETLAMAEVIGFAKLHVFPYSPRQGTVAASMGAQVAVEEKKARSRELREQGRVMREAFLSSQLGSVQEVLVEDDESGLTGNYIRVRVPEGKDGQLYQLTLRREDLRERWQ